MKSITWLILLALFGCPCQVVSQAPVPDIDIIAYINQDKCGLDFLSRIERLLSRNLQKHYQDKQVQIKVISGSDDDFNHWDVSLINNFVVLIDITKRRWIVEKSSLKIPLIFNTYKNNFNLEALVRLYQKNKNNPILIKNLQVKINGSKSSQILRNNPHDGALYLSQGKRILCENKAEEELVQLVSDEIYKSGKIGER